MATELNTEESILTRWYMDHFLKTCRYIQKNGGTLEDAKEVFQEALVRFYEKKFVDSMNIESEQGYLMQTIKNVWVTMVQKSQRAVSMDSFEIVDDEQPNPATEKIYQLIKASGEKCLDLLQSFYYEKLSMKSLAERFGYKSERSATVQKFKCIEKVRNEVKSKSLSYEEFFN